MQTVPAAASAQRMLGRRAVWLVGAAGGAAVLASLAANAALQSALRVGFRTPDTQFWYPWTVRADLLLLSALVLVVAVLAPRPAGVGGFRLSILWLAVTAALALAAAFISPLDSLAVLGALAATAWLAPRLAGEHGVLPVAFTALALRIAAALAFGGYARVNFDPAVLDDEVAYHRAATQLAGILTAGTGDLDFEWRNLAGHHLDLLAGLYVVFGEDFVLFRVLNALLGALAVPVAYAIACQLWDARAARVSAWLVALWPLLVVWGGSGLREPLVVLLALLLPWLALSAEQRLLRVLAAAMCLLVLVSLRPLIAGACMGALVVYGAWLVARRPVRARWLLLAPLGIAGALVVVSSASGGGSLAIQAIQLTPRALEYRIAATQLTPLLERDRDELPTAPLGLSIPLGTVVRVEQPGAPLLRTGVLYWYEDVPPRYVVKFADSSTVALPPSDVYFLTDETVGWRDIVERWADSAWLLLGPPALDDLRRVLTLPDTLAWVSLLALSVIGVWRAARQAGSSIWVLLAAYEALVLLGLSLASTNLGTVVRHRSALVPWLAILAAPTLVQLWTWLTARWGGARKQSASSALAILGQRAPQA